MEDNVQLREEEIVGDEVVLSDIYPKTNTASIVDDVSGTTLSEALDRIQDKINNKLSRVVNSINGRTGVVVLDSEDVGLGNVDNISFSDIKTWVINEMIAEFANKRIALLNSLEEADAIAEENQEANRDRPFFSEVGYRSTGDLKSYIGYWWYDSTAKQLKIATAPIKVIGSTDGSLHYDEETASLVVQIRPDEKALCKDPTGMYIDKSEILPTIRYFDGVWGRTDANYESNEERRETPETGALGGTEYEYRSDMKGFCPNVTSEISKNDSQFIIVRFHQALEDTLKTNYYRGDKTYDQFGDGSINFAVKSGRDIAVTSPSYDPTPVINGTHDQGLYHIAIDEIGPPPWHTRKSWTGIEYVILRTYKGTLHPNEMIYCAFRPPVHPATNERIDANGKVYHPGGIDDETLEYLTNRQPAVGIVRQYKTDKVPNTWDPSQLVILDFYEYNVHAGWSIEHHAPSNGNKALEVEVSQAKVSLQNVKGTPEEYENFSGLQVIAPQDTQIENTSVYTSDQFVVTVMKPDKWSTTWMNYYVKEGSVYVKASKKYGYDDVTKQYNRTRKYTEFIINRNTLSPSDISDISEWVVDHSTGDLAHDEKYIWLNLNLTDFKSLTPFDTFMEDPRYFEPEYVWHREDITSLTQLIPEVERDERSWTNMVRELLAYCVYYMYKDPQDPEREYIDAEEYEQRTKPPEWEPDTFYSANTSLYDRNRIVMLPSGPTVVYNEGGVRTGGLFINPDASLCIIPKRLCYFDEGDVDTPQREDSLYASMRNWRATLPKTRFSNQHHNIKNPAISSASELIAEEPSPPPRGLKDNDCYIGINVTKALKWFPGPISYDRLSQTTAPDDWESVGWAEGQTKYYVESSLYNNEFVYAEGVIREGTTVKVAPPWEKDKYYVLKEERKDGPQHKTYDKYYSYNASGLRVMGNYDDFDQAPMNYLWFGMNYNEYQERYQLSSSERTLKMDEPKGMMHSGGLSVNIGKFLEIDPGRYNDRYVNWYDNGKVNVRIGQGLMEEPITYDEQGRRLTGNKIQLKLDGTNGFIFNEKGELSTKQIISNIARLDFVDVYNTHFLYDPLPNYMLSDKIVYDDIVFQLGKGLKLVTDETRARDFDELMDKLTVVQLELFLDCSDETIYNIKGKITKRKVQCSKNDYALEADTEAINKIIMYHPSRDHGLPYYVNSLNAMIEWAINNKVDGVGEDDGARDINMMTLREFKDRVAYRYITMDNQLSQARINEYKIETLELITPYTEANTAPLAVMMKLFKWLDLEESVYNSIMHRSSDMRKKYYEILDTYGNIDWWTNQEVQYYEYPNPDDEEAITETVTYSEPIRVSIAVCQEIRAQLLNAIKNVDTYDDKLTEEASMHMMADSLGEMWTYIVENLGYTTAQEWLNDTSMGLTRDIIKNSINNLAQQESSDYDYGWSKLAKVYQERLQDDSVTKIVYVRDVNDTVVHKISASFLRLIKREDKTVSPTDVTEVTYNLLTSEPTDGSWSAENMTSNFYVKYMPTTSEGTYEANKYYRAKVTAYDKLNVEPSNWSTTYFKYYVQDANGYKHIPVSTSVPAFEVDKYYKPKTVEFVQLTDSSFTDKTFVDTSTDYTFYPPTYTKWTGKATPSTKSTTTTSTTPTYKTVASTGTAASTTSTGTTSGVGTSVNRTKTNSTESNGVIVGYTPTQEVSYVDSATGNYVSETVGGETIVAYQTTPMSSYRTNSAGTGATTVTGSSEQNAIVERWKEVWPQYWTNSAGVMKTLKEAGYGAQDDGSDNGKPYFVSGMFYTKNVPETHEVVYLDDNPIDVGALQCDTYKIAHTEDGVPPQFNAGEFYNHTEGVTYEPIYTEPSDWKTMDWPNNTKYYNWQHVLMTTDPGTFIPKNYFTKSDNDKYSVLTSKPLDWDTLDWRIQTQYFKREDGVQVKIRDDVVNATWLETGNRVSGTERLASWVVVKVDENAHAGLDGFQGEDLNTLMLYVLGRRWTLKEMINRAASSGGSSQWTNYGEDTTNVDTDSSSSDSSSSTDDSSQSGT